MWAYLKQYVGGIQQERNPADPYSSKSILRCANRKRLAEPVLPWLRGDQPALHTGASGQDKLMQLGRGPCSLGRTHSQG